MLNFFSKSKLSNQLSDLANLGKDELIAQVLPRMIVDIITQYLRVEVEGVENLPKKGPCLISPNHSGFSGFDAIVLAHEIYKQTNRVPRVLTHPLWFLTSMTSVPAKKMGLVEATTKNGLKYLDKNDLVVLFPEGENGNFKPSSVKYSLQEFKRGFIRMALQKQVPIIPTIIIGAEETHINLSKLKLSKYLRGLVLPLPLNILPLPAKWKIKFLDPIHLPYKPSAANRCDLVHELALEVREKMQIAINKELRNRDFVYFKGIY